MATESTEEHGKKRSKKLLATEVLAAAGIQRSAP